MPVIVAALLANCLFPSGASAKTPPDLDAVVERFKVAAEHEQRLDLAFQGLDRYAPIKEKSAVDRTDRDALSEMKRLVVMDLVRKHSAKALVTAIGSGGTWLIEPGRIKAERKNNFYKLALVDVTKRAMIRPCKTRRSRHGFAVSSEWSLSNWTSGDEGSGRRQKRGTLVGAGFRWWLALPACRVRRLWLA